MSIIHTPAPWTVGPDPEWPEDYSSVWYDENGTGAEIAGRIGEPANARLIAAAPELLAVLEKYVPQVEDVFVSGEWDSEAVYNFPYEDMVSAMRAAMDKARGRS